MSEQDNVKTMQAAYDAFSKGDLATVFGLLAEDAVFHQSVTKGGAYEGQRIQC